MPLQDRRRRHPARPGGPARPQSRRRRHHGGQRRRRRAGLDGFRSRDDEQDRRDGGDQELQRRHVDRRGHGRRAREGGQRQDHHRSGAGRGDREDRQRRRALGRGRTWRRRRRKRGRQDRGRGSRRCGGLVGPQDRVRQRAERPAGFRSARRRTRRRSTCAPGRPTATSPSVAASRTTTERKRHDRHDVSIRDRGHRVAQVLRRPPRARRHRPGCRRGNDLRPARPQRRREDHRRADPVHVDRVRWWPGARRGP